MAPKNFNPVRAAENNLGYLLGTTAAFHITALAFVGMRMYARSFILKAFGKDDALMLAAIVSTYIRRCLLRFLA
jgi:hypothetical protein